MFCRYISEWGNHRVSVFTQNHGRFTKAVGSRGFFPVRLRRKTCLILLFLVVTMNNAHTHMEGRSVGEFNRPEGLAVNRKFLFVTDCYNNRVQVFDKLSDEVVYVISQNFKHPIGISINK